MDTQQTRQPKLGPSFRQSSLTRVLSLMIVFGLVIAMAVGWLMTRPAADSSGMPETVTIGERSWDISEIAATDETRARGLSNRPSLAVGEAMLFVFDMPKQVGFWMKDMQFPLDMIFIRDGRVDSVALARQPGDLAPVYSVGAVDRVLEVNAGEALGIVPGDLVSFASFSLWKTIFGN